MASEVKTLKESTSSAVRLCKDVYYFFTGKIIIATIAYWRRRLFNMPMKNNIHLLSSICYDL